MSTRQRPAEHAGSTRLRAFLLVVFAAAALSLAPPASAHSRRGEGRSDDWNPIRVIAYIVHPIGYALDQLLVRPAHWIISRESLAPVFGHED